MHTHTRVARRTSVWLLAALAATAGPSGAASVDGSPPHWTSAGAGAQTLMLVHGWTCDDSSWQGPVRALMNKYRVLPLDLPDHGKSGGIEASTFSMDLFARAVQPAQAPVPVRMKGPDGPKNREAMVATFDPTIRGRDVMMEQPQEFNRLLTTFVDRLGSH